MEKHSHISNYLTTAIDIDELALHILRHFINSFFHNTFFLNCTIYFIVFLWVIYKVEYVNVK